jgi:hypothetical protein
VTGRGGGTGHPPAPPRSISALARDFITRSMAPHPFAWCTEEPAPETGITGVLDLLRLPMGFPERGAQPSASAISIESLDSPQNEQQDSDVEEIARVAKLSTREKSARKLGCRTTTLDEVAKVARDGRCVPGQCRPINLPELETWKALVAGATPLDEMSSTISTYVVVSKEQADARALVHTCAAAKSIGWDENRILSRRRCS